MKPLHAVTALLLAGPAWADGGGGPLVEIQGIPRYGPRDAAHRAPGLLGCLGGTGHGLVAGEVRVGGEAVGCAGRRGIGMGYVGVLAAWQVPIGPTLFWTTGASAGVGGFQDASLPDDVGTYRSAFIYAKPSIGFGRALGWTAMDVTASVMIPVNLAQWVGGGSPRGFVTPGFALQATWLFGRFDMSGGAEAYLDEPEQVEPPPTPQVPPDRPLAIPEGGGPR